MQIRNVTENDLHYALLVLNKRYENNISFRRLEKRKTYFICTLRVKDSRGPGAKLGFSFRKDGERRRTPAACWHVHGHFFDLLLNLSPNAKIKALRKVIEKVDGKVIGNWEDISCSSQSGLVMSELCHCP